MSDALRRHVQPTRYPATPQRTQAREDQVKNNAGGYVFTTDEETRLHRFLTIGVEGGTFHVGEPKLARDNGSVVVALAKRSDMLLISKAVEISVGGRAPSNDQALFALAAAAGLGDTAYREAALAALPSVARTGTHLLTFIEYVEMFRGWGPQLVKGIRNWYLQQTPDNLAYQVFKYKQRKGWAQRDPVRLALFKASPKHKDGQPYRAGSMPRVPAEHEPLLRYLTTGAVGDSELPQLYYTMTAAHATRKAAEWERLIASERGLTWEMLPSEALTEPKVWRALVDHGNLPMHALLRNLSRLTNLGVLKQGDAWTKELVNQLSDSERLAKARVHPITILLALKTYAQGHSMRGESRWTPVSVVTDGLDASFYAAFPAVRPAGNRVEVALDVSGTMTHPAGGLPITCREVCGAMAQITVGTEPLASVYGFGTVYQPLDISPRRRMDDNMRYMAGIGMQRTDCAVPMTDALKARREVDVFQIWTDNETWAGPIHVHEALRQYRDKMGINVKLEVVCIVPTEFSVADPRDPNQLDVSGFDAAVPQLLADHARGDL